MQIEMLYSRLKTNGEGMWLAKLGAIEIQRAILSMLLGLKICVMRRV